MSRETYSSLFSVIGTSFGEGDGEDTFNVPDLRESVPKGVGLNPNGEDHVSEEGLALGEFLDDRIQDHRHDYSVWPKSTTPEYDDDTSYYGMENAKTYQTSYVKEDPGIRKGPTTEVKSIGVNYIIKY